MTEQPTNDDRAAEAYRAARERMMGVTAGLAGVLGPDHAARLLMVSAVTLLLREHGKAVAAKVLTSWSDELLAEDLDGRPN